MKITVLLFACLVLASCGSDDKYATVDPVQELLTGKWQLQSIVRNGTALSPEECENQNTLEFKGSGAFTQLEYSIPTGATACAITNVVNGSFSVEESIITFDINEAEADVPATVTEVTGEVLKINTRWYLTEEEEGSDDITFTKVTQ